MKGIMITAPSSNSGKTTVTTGIIKAISNRGIKVAPFKTGPDYIDGKYLSLAAGKLAGNLDFHLQGSEGIKEAVSMGEGDITVVEGVMGYFDGSSNSWESSSYHLSTLLDIPAVLVYTPEGEMFSVVPKIKGMAEFEDSRIKAVILNKTSEKMFLLLKEAIEKHTNLSVIGYIPYEEELSIESESLGLIRPQELPGLENSINKIADLCEKHIDLDRLLELANEIEYNKKSKNSKFETRIAIAKDDAFCFHYAENLKIMDSMANLEYFSPLDDKKLPEADLIIIGGGYPEKYLDRLSENVEMVKSIREYGLKKGYLLAEGGGMMYLMDTIDGVSMCGLLKGDVEMTDRLQRFGYVDIHIEKDCILGKAGTVIPGNEFHKSIVKNAEEGIFEVKKPKGPDSWRCGYSTKNILGSYQHLNFAGKRDLLMEMLEGIHKGGRLDVY